MDEGRQRDGEGAQANGRPQKEEKAATQLESIMVQSVSHTKLHADIIGQGKESSKW